MHVPLKVHATRGGHQREALRLIGHAERRPRWRDQATRLGDWRRGAGAAVQHVHPSGRADADEGTAFVFDFDADELFPGGEAGDGQTRDRRARRGR
jgi:hypothetical protein